MATWQPSAADLAAVIVDQNPWSNTGAVPGALAPPTERSLAQILWRRLLAEGPRRFQVILGPRRVGKTTVLYQTVRRLIDAGIPPRRTFWLRLDHPLLMGHSLGDLARLALQLADASPEEPCYLMLDELAYAKDWDRWLKTFHDEQWPVRIAATSSATASLRRGRSESGVGRWEQQHLLPYSYSEFVELAGGAGPAASTEMGPDEASTLSAEIRCLAPATRPGHTSGLTPLLYTLIGGFPELLLQAAESISARATESGEAPDLTPNDLNDLILTSQRTLRQDAVERAVYKDIPQSFGLSSPLMLERFLCVLAGQVTGLLSQSRVSGELGIAQPTLDRYLSYLEQTYMMFTLANFAGTEASVQRRGRRLYFVDGAVRNAALLRGLRPLTDPAETGLLLENLAATTLHTFSLLAGIRLFHWRRRHDEVDLVLDDPNGPLAFEIASSPSHSRSGLHAFAESHPHFRSGCYLVAPQALVTHPDGSDTKVGTLPLDRFLLAVGAQTRALLRQQIA